jgi:hypothetical protein
METKMEEVIVIVGDRVSRAPHRVWSALLEASSLMIDTGDMYPHLKSKLGKELLDDVKQLKIELDAQNDSVS